MMDMDPTNNQPVHVNPGEGTSRNTRTSTRNTSVATRNALLAHTAVDQATHYINGSDPTDGSLTKKGNKKKSTKGTKTNTTVSRTDVRIPDDQLRPELPVNPTGSASGSFGSGPIHIPGLDVLIAEHVKSAIERYLPLSTDAQPSKKRRVELPDDRQDPKDSEQQLNDAVRTSIIINDINSSGTHQNVNSAVNMYNSQLPASDTDYPDSNTRSGYSGTQSSTTLPEANYRGAYTGRGGPCGASDTVYGGRGSIRASAAVHPDQYQSGSESNPITISGADRRTRVLSQPPPAHPFANLLVGDGLPSKFRGKIAKNEYIELADFDYSNYKRGGGPDQPLTIQFDEHDRPFLAKANNSAKATSFNQWSKNFNKFMSLYLDIHGGGSHGSQLARELITYHESVREMWEKGGKWEQYDDQFRRLMEDNPFSWADHDVRSNLQFKFTSVASHSNQNRGGQPYNNRIPAAGGARNTGSTSDLVVPNTYCTNYHIRYNCKRNPCGYKHFCFKCCAGEHPAGKCNASYANKDAKAYVSPSPVNPITLNQLLLETGYDNNLRQFLVQGFSQGFKLGHAASLSNSYAAFPTTDQDARIIQSKLDTELEMGRIAGPFPAPPFQNFQISPLFLREKATPGQFRMILDLSFPKQQNNINSNISESYRSIKYSSVREAIMIISALGAGTYTAKVDIKDAFRLIPLHPTEYPKVCFTNLGKVYYDKVLPQGCASSCFLFEQFATALHHIFKFYAIDCDSLHYLDDFLFIHQTEEGCLLNRKVFQHICARLGVPLSSKKITMPAQNTVFLGLTLDSAQLCVKLPEDKLAQYTSDLKHFLALPKVTIKQIQSIAGKLNFAATAVPGRVFLRSTIDSMPTNASEPVTLSTQTRKDLSMWLTFFRKFNGTSFFRCLNKIDSRAVNMGADACKQGFGAVFGKKWLQAEYPVAWQNTNIAFLEFYPIYVLLAIYGHQLQNSIIIFHTDNMAVKHIINTCTSKDFYIQHYFRKLMLILLKYNIDLRAKHVPGKDNILCDRISRFQITPQDLTDFNMHPTAEKIPHWLLPKVLLNKPYST